MRNILKIILFATVCFTAHAQTVTYEAETAVITNPEKGFYHYTSTGSSGGYNLISTAINSYRDAENISVVQRQFFLRDFIKGTPIASTYLVNMQRDFDRIRAAGLKVIARFTYTSSSSFTVFQPTKAQILAHIDQLAPVLNANKDVLVSIQAGFIGKYGEWYYTGSSEFGDGNYNNYTALQWANRKEVMDALINKFPKEIPLQLRYVAAKQKMYGSSYVGRIGFYNDSFLGTYGDSGTFTVSGSQGSPLSTEVSYWQSSTATNPVSGETNMVNAPRTECSNAMMEMDKYNWSLINKDYFGTVISDWQSKGCFPTMQKSLGYDLRLNYSSLVGNILIINMGNYGYANLFKRRKAVLVCKDIASNTNYFFDVDQDLRNVQGKSYDIVVDLNKLLFPAGKYELYLSLPDPISKSILYSIRTSNKGLWTPEGLNSLKIFYEKK